MLKNYNTCMYYYDTKHKQVQQHTCISIAKAHTLQHSIHDKFLYAIQFSWRIQQSCAIVFARSQLVLRITAVYCRSSLGLFTL